MTKIRSERTKRFESTPPPPVRPPLWADPTMTRKQLAEALHNAEGRCTAACAAVVRLEMRVVELEAQRAASQASRASSSWLSTLAVALGTSTVGGADWGVLLSGVAGTSMTGSERRDKAPESS